jgi:protein associated with RNAse G/E
VIIHKLDVHGKELWQYPAKLLERSDSELVFEAVFDRDVDLEGMQLRKGDLFIEYFYLDRWYNIFKVFEAASSELKGWYCNVTRPARMEGENLYADDLALDLLVYPDKSFQVLDEDEFDELDIPSADRINALAAMDELMKLAQLSQGPFMFE